MVRSGSTVLQDIHQSGGDKSQLFYLPFCVCQLWTSPGTEVPNRLQIFQQSPEDQVRNCLLLAAVSPACSTNVDYQTLHHLNSLRQHHLQFHLHLQLSKKLPLPLRQCKSPLVMLMVLVLWCLDHLGEVVRCVGVHHPDHSDPHHLAHHCSSLQSWLFSARQNHINSW